MTYACAPPGGGRWVKDPADVAPYTFEWDDWLTEGETITAATVDVTDGLTKIADQIDPERPHVTVKVSGGTAGSFSAPNRVAVTCMITTSVGNVYETTKYITVQERES